MYTTKPCGLGEEGGMRQIKRRRQKIVVTGFVLNSNGQCLQVEDATSNHADRSQTLGQGVCAFVRLHQIQPVYL